MSAVDYKEQFVTAKVDHTLIDVRSSEEYEISHLAGSVNIPLEEIGERLAEIPGNRPIVVYCRTGNRSGKAAKFLEEIGCANVSNAGGLSELAEVGLLVES